MSGKIDIPDFLQQYIYPFQAVESIFDPTLGFIVWRTGTGRNVELLHLRAFEKRKGYGRKLFYRMLDRLKKTPPYYSIFSFCRTVNEDAIQFYLSNGFFRQNIDGVYKDGHSIIFHQSFDVLVARQEAYDDAQRSIS